MVDDQRHGGSCSICALLDVRSPPAYQTFHLAGFAFDSPVARTILERARVSSKLRDIFIYNEYDTIKETQEPDKVGFAEVVKSEKWEVSRSKCDPSNCRI